jgi:hypothetical protein
MPESANKSKEAPDKEASKSALLRPARAELVWEGKYDTNGRRFLQYQFAVDDFVQIHVQMVFLDQRSVPLSKASLMFSTEPSMAKKSATARRLQDPWYERNQRRVRRRRFSRTFR